MTPKTFATVAARLVGVLLLLQAALGLPSLYMTLTIPHVTVTDLPSFETTLSPDSPSYETMKRASENFKESLERTQSWTPWKTFSAQTTGTPILSGFQTPCQDSRHPTFSFTNDPSQLAWQYDLFEIVEVSMEVSSGWKCPK